MGRLYWKIFLGFWLSTIAIVAVTTWSVALLTDEDDAWPSRADGRRQHWLLMRDVATAELLLETGGTVALSTWLDNHRRLWALDADGRDLLGRPLPESLRKLLGDPDTRLPAINTPDGTVYRLWRVPLERSLMPRRPERLLMGLTVAFLVSGLVCWLLARYLTRPVRHLQTATRRLADGDLAVRVVPAIGRRRDEIADLGTDFDRMAEWLERVLTAQRQLLRDISHELRSPLARLQVALGLARRRGQGAERELDRIELEADRLETLIDRLLSLQRLESGTVVPARDPVDLVALLHEVARDAGFEAAHRDRQVEVTAAEPCVVIGDRELLRSALDNLVSNAVRHTAADTTVSLILDQVGNSRACRIRVRDHGPGVPESDLPRLFDPFYRVEAARERSSGGYGLGLAIAAHAIRLHGGKLTARNVAPEGLEVTIELHSASIQNHEPWV